MTEGMKVTLGRTAVFPEFLLHRLPFHPKCWSSGRSWAGKPRPPQLTPCVPRPLHALLHASHPHPSPWRFGILADTTDGRKGRFRMVRFGVSFCLLLRHSNQRKPPLLVPLRGRELPCLQAECANSSLWVPSSHSWVSFIPKTKWSSFGDVQSHFTGQTCVGVNAGTPAISQTHLEEQTYVYL